MALSKVEKKTMCAGCRDDFYNGNNPYGVKECWGLKSAKKRVRYRIGTWTVPTEPYAFTKVTTLSCYGRKGSVLYNGLPDFVDRAKVRGLEAAQ